MKRRVSASTPSSKSSKDEGAPRPARQDDPVYESHGQAPLQDHAAEEEEDSQAPSATQWVRSPGSYHSRAFRLSGNSQGEPVARTTVTKQMSAYIKDNNLQNPERKREIVLDNSLAKLFSKKVGDTIEYFEIQKLLKNHYIKANA